VAQFATAKAGLILVNLNPAYRAGELKFAIRKAGCKAIFMARSFKSSDYLDMMLQVAPELATCEPGALHAEQLPTLRTVIVFDDGPAYGTYDYETLLTLAREEHVRRVDELRVVLQPDDVINIQFTSGTTGLPKGAGGRVVPRGCEGELLTRGYSVMQGYWEDGEATRHVIDDARWMHTGDLAVLDDQGYCRIVGRLKDIIIRGGENISPREVEECLYQHPAVQDVSVFGVPDMQYGEEICAWIRLKPGTASSVKELQDFCRGQIAHFKVPRYFRFVVDFPMTVTGKIQKFVMREQMAGEVAQTRVTGAA
jgi:acyl-CoA synthetase (AMP-forming)/AMP-acid ligase II